MVLGLEIGLLIAGLYALITGRLKLSKNRITTGASARFAGILFLLPLPLAFGVLMILAMDRAAHGKPLDSTDWQLTSSLIELGICIVCALLGFGIALATSTRIDASEPRRPKSDKRSSSTPASAEEEPAWVLPTAGPVDAIQSEPLSSRPPARMPARAARPGLAKRPQPAPSSSSPVVWWVLGGLAACFFCCALPAGGLLAWWLWRTPAAQPAVASRVVEGRPAVEADNPQLGPKQDWGENMQKFPQVDLPPGAGGPMGPGNLRPPGGGQPAEPPFKPIVLPQPNAPHLNIRPPKLPAERVVRPLPSTIGDVAVGGGGRFLILHLPRERKLAIFDVNTARVEKYLSFAEDIKFTAGMDKLLVALPDKNILQRWSLTTFERELSVPLAGDGQVQLLTMGSASNGPLLIRQGREGPGAFPSMTFFDIRTMKPLEAKWGNNPGGPLDARYVRASANGKVFGLLGWGPVTLVWDGGRITITHLMQPGGQYVLPSPDGKAVFTDSAIYTELLKPAAGAANVKGAMPATHGRFYMAGQSVYLLGDSRPLLTVPAEKPEPGANDLNRILQMMNANEQLALDKRGYFIPDAKLVIHIPLSNDQLVLRRLDVEAGLEKSGIDYLFVVSQAPFKAKKGATYRYQLAVKSKKGGVTYRLESGPKEMKISNTGLLTWDVPRFVSESRIDVILTIGDRSGQEIFHNFPILPGDQGEEQVAPAVADIPPEPVKSDEIRVVPKPVKPAAPPAPEPVKPATSPPKDAAVRELRSMRISKNSYVHALLFTPDGREVLSAGDDGRLRRWSVDDGKELSTSFDPHPRVSMLSIGVSADGKRIVTSSLDKTAKVWDADTNKLLTTCTCSERIPFVRAALSPDGKIVATGTNQVRLWDATTGREIGLLKSRLVFIEALVFSSDSKLLACSGSGNTVKLWNVAERKETATLTGHTKLVMCLAFSADGKTLASASADRTIKLWDLATNKERLTLSGHADPLSSVAFSPDGKLLLSGAGAIRFDPGRRGEVKLWDATTGKLLTDLRGHTDGVSSVAFSSDGKTVASTARDHTVRLWDVSAFVERRNATASKSERE
jgi:WD40 repeat protein